MRELWAICCAFEQLENDECALATVVRIEGSAYRKAGSRMLILPDGRTEGMISGGCLEHEVIDHARRAIQSKRSRTVRFDSTTEDDVIYGTGSGCNGVIDVFVQPLPRLVRNILSKAVAATLRSRAPGVIATIIQSCTESLVGSSAWLQSGTWEGDSTLVQAIEAGELGVDSPQVSRICETKDGSRVFLQPLLPPIQLVVFGGWLDVTPLIRLARELGWQVAVVDARRRLSSLHYLAEADSIHQCSAQEALERILVDSRTVAVVMNHHFNEDYAALLALSKRCLPYVGVLGSQRRFAQMCDLLRPQTPDAFCDNLFGPIGLDIGAKLPEEIGLSIVAEILSVLTHSSLPFRDRSAQVQNTLTLPLYG